jgi:hypothetical protein
MPGFTVRMTITPVVVGKVAWAWAADGWVMEAAPVRVRAIARTPRRIAFIGLVSRIMAVTLFVGIASPDLRLLPMSDYPR